MMVRIAYWYVYPTYILCTSEFNSTHESSSDAYGKEFPPNAFVDWQRSDTIKLGNMLTPANLKRGTKAIFVDTNMLE